MMNKSQNMTDKIMTFVIAYLVCIGWVILWEKSIEFFGYPYDIEDGGYESIQHSIFYSFIWAPIWEELAFRYAPLEVAKIIDKRLILPVAVGISIFFGWIHHYNPESVLLQGVLGFILSVVYIRNGLVWSILLHCIYNLTVTFL